MSRNTEHKGRQYDEEAILLRRIAKAQRRIAAGYKTPEGQETEEAKKERLSQRLKALSC